MKIKEIVKNLSIEEKAMLITGAGNMDTASIERLNIKSLRLADGPHGIRAKYEDNCTAFPCLCSVGATWNKELIFKMGEALANDCIEHGVNTILGPGINIKRTPLCGRNFEYISEDPVLSGELGAAYINGVQSKGVGTCLKHFALNNQEQYRSETSVEVDIRVLHEIYLKGFEIAVKKSNPYSIMCAYNKVNSIYCSENKYLLNDVLKEKWGYKGCIISDWGAVHDICKAISSGLDIQMPKNGKILNQIKVGISNGNITLNDIDRAVEAVLNFILVDNPNKNADYDRNKQHEIAKVVASEGVVLLKNENNILPLKKGVHKRIAVIGEYAEKPIVAGQGSAEVYPDKKYTESPLEELKKHFGQDAEIKYLSVFSKTSLPEKMIWPYAQEWKNFVSDCDAVIVFAGTMESEDTETFDRRTIEINPNFSFVINNILEANKNVIVVIQSGSAVVLSELKIKVPAILQMWLAGEAAGAAITDVLIGKVNPSGKLPETFPKRLRTDLEYPGDGLKVRYTEGFDVGYRYYDKHTDEICFPFGFGLSYTEFKLSNFSIYTNETEIEVNFNIENCGDFDGSEVVQIYVSKPESIVTRSPKELKLFEKITVEKGQNKDVLMSLPIEELAYYNYMLDDWIVEPGEYKIMIAKSSRDVLYQKEVMINSNVPYTIEGNRITMIG